MTRKNNALMNVCPLASGSRGNSLFVSCGKSSVLIDAGLSGIEIQRRMDAAGISADNLTGIIITHEHTDHVKGAGILSRRFKIPVYITPLTYQACSALGKIDDLRFFECGTPFEIDSILVNPFSTSHDACDPAGLTLEYQDKKVGIATDLGIVTHLVKEHLRGSQILYIESNHDPVMLMEGPYPWHLKQRIKGRTGHLSNPDARQLVSELISDGLKHVILAHLSEENNCPEIAGKEVSKGLNGFEVSLHIASPDKPGAVIRI